MGYWKHYFNDILCESAPENKSKQDRLERVVISGQIKLTGDKTKDVHTIKLYDNSMHISFKAH